MELKKKKEPIKLKTTEGEMINLALGVLCFGGGGLGFAEEVVEDF